MTPGQSDPASLRRRLLCAAVGGTLLQACAPQSALLRGTRASFTLARARVSTDRVIRVLVGLRPYRPGGYVVREEMLGTKRVIHNYGHGGAGITLSWGTSQQALDIGYAGASKPYAVIGCGAVGLANAILLQRRGGQVTIYAKALPPDTTSNIAGGHWSPFSVFAPGAASAEFMEQFHAAVRSSYRMFQAMAGPRHGVSWRRNFVLREGPVQAGPLQEAIRDVLPELASLKPGEHPFGDRHVLQYQTMMIEPNVYLPSMIDIFLAAGGRIVVREFSNREELASLPEPILFNCTGLGARDLFGDEQLFPARGQLVVLLPQPEVDYNTFRDRYYIFPRADGILLGGTFDRGNWDLTPDPATTTRLIEENARTMALLTATVRGSG